MNRCTHEKFSECRLCPSYGDMMQYVAVPTTDTSTYRAANTDGVFQHGIEHRLYVGRIYRADLTVEKMVVGASISTVSQQMQRWT